jgi:hypothetical protein
VGDEFAMVEAVKSMRERIHTVLRVAWGGRNLVLAAMGCEAFCNPPRAVATLFRGVLLREEFRERFEGVWFAVIERGGTGYFAIFKDVLMRWRFDEVHFEIGYRRGAPPAYTPRPQHTTPRHGPTIAISDNGSPLLPDDLAKFGVDLGWHDAIKACRKTRNEETRAPRDYSSQKPPLV